MIIKKCTYRLSVVLGSSHLAVEINNKTITAQNETIFVFPHLIVGLSPAIFDTALVLWGRWGFRGLGGDNMFVLADAAVFQRYSPTSKAPPCLGPSPCLGIKRQKSIRGMRSSLFWPCRGFPCQRFFFARGLHVCQSPCHKTYCLGSLFDYFKNSSCLGSLAWSSIV